MKISKEAQEVFNDPTAIKVLATKSSNNLHVIPLGSLSAPTADIIAFAAIMVKEAHENLLTAKKQGETVSALVVKARTEKTPAVAYQVRCKVKEFATSGPIYDIFSANLKKMSFSARGVWLLEPIEVIDQTPGPNAGKKMQ